ncbi:MAG: glutathione S-transferase [Pseudomonadota bacterium]
MIRVHHLNKSRSLRILWLLEEIGETYEVVRYERDPATRLAPEALKKIHPLGKSPAVEVDGHVVTESGAIVDYICATRAPAMIPKAGTPDYVKHLELTHFAEGSVMTPILLNLYVGLLGDAGAPLQPRIQSELKSHFDYLESQLRPSGHFVLDTLSAADIMLSFPAGVITRLGKDTEYPGLASFNAAVATRPAFLRALDAGGGD